MFFLNAEKVKMFRKLDPKAIAIKPISIFVDDVSVAGEDGEPVAAILLRLSPPIARTTPVSGAARAPYCMMGACFDCLVEIDGASSVRSCMQQARDGMIVRRQVGLLRLTQEGRR